MRESQSYSSVDRIIMSKWYVDQTVTDLARFLG